MAALAVFSIASLSHPPANASESSAAG